jgi:hypothetical protein
LTDRYPVSGVGAGGLMVTSFLAMEGVSFFLIPRVVVRAESMESIIWTAERIIRMDDN